MLVAKKTSVGERLRNFLASEGINRKEWEELKKEIDVRFDYLKFDGIENTVIGSNGEVA